MAVAEELLACSLPGGVTTRARFEWRYGKCEERHWGDVFARFAEYLTREGVRAIENRWIRDRGDDASERIEAFAAVNWIMEFMREIVENCGELPSFAHGEATALFLEFFETCESALRLLAAATRRSVVGRTPRNAYFSSDVFQRRVRFMLSKIHAHMPLSAAHLNDADENESKACEVVAHELFVAEDREEGSGPLDCTRYEFTVDTSSSGSDEIVFKASGRRGLDPSEMHRPYNRASSLECLIDDFSRPQMFDPGKEMDSLKDISAAYFGVLAQLWSKSLQRTRAGREKAARLSILAQQINVHLGKGAEPSDFELYVEDAQTTAIKLLDLMQVDLGVTPSLLLRRDATTLLSAYTNERASGFQVCQIMRRPAGRGALSQCVSTMTAALLAPLSSSDAEIDFDVVRDARCLMHLVGILSTTTPGCTAIREAELLPLLMSIFKLERLEAIPVVVDVVHTVESYLDFQPNAVVAFRELNGTDLLLKRMRYESVTAIEELQASGHLDDVADRKRKIDSLSSLEDAETSLAAMKKAPKYVNFHRRVLIKALMRTLAYTSFAYGGARMRVPGLSDGTLTDILGSVLKYPLKFGPGVSSLTANLVCDVIHNEPTCYATLDEAGIVDAFLKFITETMWPLGRSKGMAKVLCAIPTTLNAICLNEKGQEKVLKSSALVCFRKMFQDSSFPLNADTSRIVGTGINETLRHIPALKDVSVEVLNDILSDLTIQLRKISDSETNLEHAFVNKAVVEQMPISKTLQNVARFMDGILQTSHMCAPLVQAGALDSMLNMLTCPLPVEFSTCASYNSISVACKSLINPPDPSNSYAGANTPNLSDDVILACTTVVEKYMASAVDIGVQIEEFYVHELDKTGDDIDKLATYDIYSKTLSEKHKGDKAALDREVRFCRQTKSLCQRMAAHERLCELLATLVQQVPVMSAAIMNKRRDDPHGPMMAESLFNAALAAFNEAVKIEAKLRSLAVEIQADEMPYSPVWWLYTRADLFVRVTSGLFAAVAKLSTTMRRRKDLGPEAQNFIKLSGEAIIAVAREMTKAFTSRVTAQAELLPPSHASNAKMDFEQRCSHNFLALIYESFFDDKRNSPNGVMINYAARCGLFEQLYTHFQGTVALTQSILETCTGEKAEQGHVAAECYRTLSCFVRIFVSISDVKLMASNNSNKLALGTRLPERVEDDPIYDKMTKYTHISDAFTNSRSAMDWIHCSLNEALKCIWRPETDIFASVAAGHVDSDALVQCLLNIISGTEQAVMSEQRRAASVPRAPPRPPPRQFVPSETMIDSIVEMGFSRGHAHHALAAVNGQSVERALEYMLTRPMEDVPDEAPTAPSEPAPSESTALEETADAMETAPVAFNHTHAVQGRLPAINELVAALYANFHISAEKGATLLLKVIEKHELMSGLSRDECIYALTDEVVRTRTPKIGRDEVYAIKHYAFVEALARQGDEVLRRALWIKGSVIDSQVETFIAEVDKICAAQKTASLETFLKDVPLSFVPLANCINAAACLQKHRDSDASARNYSKFGFLNDGHKIALADACVECLIAIVKNSGELASDYESHSVQAVILDLLANLSRDNVIADRIASNSFADSKDGAAISTRSFAHTLFTCFWNNTNDSVSVILRHMVNDPRTLQSAMELDIVKSITKPPMGRDSKVALKTFCVAMKNIIERDFDCFEAAFANVAEIRTMADTPLSTPREYVIPTAEVKAMQSLPTVRLTKNLRMVVEVLVAVATEPIHQAPLTKLERQAAAFRLLTELVEVYPSSVKALMDMDDQTDIFRNILRYQLPSSRRSSSSEQTGVWCGCENAAFFLATLCVNSQKARTKIIEKMLVLLKEPDLTQETASTCADKGDSLVPKHAFVDLLHSLMDYGLARGYQSGERIRNRVVFNLQQGVLKTMYSLKVPERIIELIEETNVVGAAREKRGNPGFLRVTLAVLEALVVRSTKSKRESRLTRIGNMVRAVNAARVPSGEEVEERRALTEQMLQNLLEHAAGGNIQVARLEDDLDGMPEIEGVHPVFGGDDGDADGIDADDGHENSDDDSEMEVDDDHDHDSDEANEEGMHESSDEEQLSESGESGESSGTSDSSEEDSEEEEEEEDDEEGEEGEEAMADDFYGSDMDHIDPDPGNDVLEMSDDALYDEDGEEFDYDDGGGSDDDDDDDEEEGDFEEPSSPQSSYTSPSGVRVLPRATHSGSHVERTSNLGSRDHISVSRAQVEAWFATDYSSVMSGADPRVEAQTVGELQIAGGQRAEVSTEDERQQTLSESRSEGQLRGHNREHSPRSSSVNASELFNRRDVPFTSSLREQTQRIARATLGDPSLLARGNPPVHGSPWHTWSQSETGVPPALNHEGINVQRVGTSLNITLSTPMDFSSRSRSLHDVLNSISGEMARLAVRPSHLEILDPLSSAKAILWLGDGSFQATAPAEFSVRNQTIWSLDGRNARASFWSNAVCMSIGESLATSGTFLSHLDTAELATSSLVSSERDKENVNGNLAEIVDESPEERTARQRREAAALDISANELSMVTEDLRDGFLNANRLVARAREQAPEAASDLNLIGAEFLSAMPADIQRELIQRTTSGANRLLTRIQHTEASPSVSAPRPRANSPTTTVTDTAPLEIGNMMFGEGWDGRLDRHEQMSWNDIERIRQSSTRDAVAPEDFKPLKVNVELRHQHIRTLLLLFFVQTIDLKDTVNKICVNLCVVDQNRESILRQIIETVIMNTMDRADPRFIESTLSSPNAKGLEPSAAMEVAMARSLCANLSERNGARKEMVTRRLLTLLSQLISRNRHVHGTYRVRGVNLTCVKLFFAKDEDASMVNFLTNQKENGEAVLRSDAGVSTVDIPLLSFLVGLLAHASQFHDQKNIELCATCTDAYLTKFLAATPKPNIGPKGLSTAATPELLASIASFLKVPYLAPSAYEKINTILQKVLGDFFEEGCDAVILNRFHADALQCSVEAIACLSKASSIKYRPNVDEPSARHVEYADSRQSLKTHIPYLRRLTDCFVQVLTYLDGKDSRFQKAFKDKAKEELIRYHDALRPFWQMMNVYASLMQDITSDESGDASILCERSHASAALTEGITTYLMIGTSLYPYVEGEVSKSRRESGAFQLPALAGSMRAPSPAMGMRASHASHGSLHRTSSHMLDALSNSGGKNAKVAAILSDIWAFVEQHRNMLNDMLKQRPLLLSGPMKILLSNPRLLDFSVKRAEIRTRIKKLRERLGHNRPEARTLHIRRDRILEDSFRQLNSRSIEEIRGKISIVFVGEEGMDGGGLIKEWFTILAREVFNPNIALFELSHDKGCYQPNQNSVVHPDYLSYFRFVGRLVGKALFDDILLNAYFTRPIYKHLLGQQLTYEDMEGVDPDYYKSLKWMLENSVEGVMEYTFSDTTSYFGETQVYDLIENGRNIAVTDANKFEYVNLITAHRMTNAVKDQLAALVKGFEEVVPRETISILNASELELLISGTPDIDVEDLRANTEYTGFTVGSKQIQWFWDVVREMNKEDLARLLMFCTGTSKVPLDGFGALQGMQGPQRFQIHRQHADDSKLPSAHTCFNQLDLHEYSSKQILRDRLLYAIVEGCEGFGFI